MADKLSGWDQVLGTEWSLHVEVVERLFHLWGRPTVDLFATRYNRKLYVFCSVILDPWAVAEHALQHPWGNLDVYQSNDRSDSFVATRRVVPQTSSSADRDTEGDSHFFDNVKYTQI